MAAEEAFTALDNYSIFDACSVGDSRKLKLLLDFGTDVNLKSIDRGASPLHIAALNGHASCIKILVARGANIKGSDNNGKTPLHILVSKRYDQVAIWLITKGADIHQQDSRGFSALDQALDNFQQELIDASKAATEGKDRAKKNVELTIPSVKNENSGQNLNSQSERSVPGRSDTFLKIFLENETYRMIKVTGKDTGISLAEKMSDRLNMADIAEFL